MLARRFWTIISSAGVIFALVLVPTASLAANDINGRPGKPDPEVPASASQFVYSLAPGQVWQDSLLVQNSTSEPARVLIYPADASADALGKIVLAERTANMSGVGSWVRLFPLGPPEPSKEVSLSFYETAGGELETILGRCNPLNLPEGSEFTSVPEYHTDRLGAALSIEQTEYIQALSIWCAGLKELELSLEPEQVRSVPFVIAIPEELAAGEHVGGFVLAQSESDMTHVRISQTTPGELIQSLTISDFKVVPSPVASSYDVSIQLRNEGNILATTAVTLNVGDNGESKTQTQTFEIFPDSSLVAQFISPRPLVGQSRFQVSVSYGDEVAQNLTSEPITIWAVPWALAIIILVLIVFIIILLIITYRKKLSLDTSSWVRHTVKPGENLEDIAEQLNIKWKDLARVNQLSRPYTLSDGQLILVPQVLKKAVKQQDLAKVRETTQRAKPEASGLEPLAAEPPAAAASVPPHRKLKPLPVILGALVILALLVIFLIPNIDYEVVTPEVNSIEVIDPGPTVPLGDLMKGATATSTEVVAVEADTIVEEIPPLAPEDVLVQVLNGSGKPGAAGKLARSIQAAGFTIDHTGNADNFNYISTTLYYPDGLEAEAALLELTFKELEIPVTLKERNDLGDNLLTALIGRE